MSGYSFRDVLALAAGILALWLLFVAFFTLLARVA